MKRILPLLLFACLLLFPAASEASPSRGVALSVLKRYEAVSSQYGKAIAANPAGVQGIYDYAQCITGEFNLSETQLNADSAIKQNFLVAYIFSMYAESIKIIPVSGQYNVSTLKRSLNKKGRQILRSRKPSSRRMGRALVAHSDLVSEFRALSDIDICQVLADWRTGGYVSDDLLAEIVPYVNEITGTMEISLERINGAALVMKSVRPQISSARIDSFTNPISDNVLFDGQPASKMFSRAMEAKKIPLKAPLFS